MPAAVLTNPSDAYRRQARRLRHRLAGQPARLCVALRELSDHHDAIHQCGARRHVNETASRSEAFARHVVAFTSEGQLRYSQRLSLLATADELGLGRFEANLIIAAIEHHLMDRRRSGAQPIARRASRFGAPALTAILVQLSIALAAWWLFLH